MFNTGGLVKTADEKIFFEGDRNWSYNLYTITEIFNDTKHTYHIKKIARKLQ